jgi:hypothetical protein
MNIEFVIVQLMIHKEHDHHKTGNSRGQSGNIQEGDQQMLPDVTKSNLEIMFYHGPDFQILKQ